MGNDLQLDILLAKVLQIQKNENKYQALDPEVLPVTGVSTEFALIVPDFESPPLRPTSARRRSHAVEIVRQLRPFPPRHFKRMTINLLCPCVFHCL